MSNAAPVDPPEDHAPPILVAVPPLGELLAGDPPDFDDEPVAPVDADQANRWLYRIAQLDAADAADIEIANTERARIDLWLSLQLQRRAHDRDWLTKSLTLMHETAVRNGGPKTVHLPNGTLVARQQPPEWTFDDRFIDWAEKHNPDLLRRPPAEIDKNAAKKAIDPDGNIVSKLDPGDELFVAPGVTVIKRPDKVTIKAGGTR